MLIGGMTEEFEIKPTGEGPITVVITGDVSDREPAEEDDV